MEAEVNAFHIVVFIFCVSIAFAWMVYMLRDTCRDSSRRGNISRNIFSILSTTFKDYPVNLNQPYMHALVWQASYGLASFEDIERMISDLQSREEMLPFLAMVACKMKPLANKHNELEWENRFDELKIFCMTKYEEYCAAR